MQNNLFRKTTAYVLMVMMLFSLIGILPIGTESYADGTSLLKVLEVQPGAARANDGSVTITYTLNSKTGYELNRMSMAEFNSKIDAINGKYDIVYIGEKTGSYTKAGVDITNKRAAELLEYVNSGQIAIFGNSVFSTTGKNTNAGNTTVLFSTFKDLKNTKITQVAPNIAEQNLYALIEGTTGYSSKIHRPIVTVNSKPVEYDGTTDSYSPDKVMMFNFDLSNGTDGLMTTKLYIDYDGDGLFKSTESDDSISVKNKNSGSGYTLNYTVPHNYTGVLPWKLETTDINSGAKAFSSGYSAFKSAKLNIRVLQVKPDSDNTFDVATLLEGMLNTEEYNITITSVTKAQFANMTLNGIYDMVIMGFKDSYGDPTNTTNLMDFVKTGQSVMFTHDSMNLGSSNAFLTTGWNVGAQHKNVGQISNKTSYWTDRRASIGGETFPRSTYVRMTNDTLLSHYPYILNDIKVSTTHYQYYKLDIDNAANQDVVPVYTLNGKWRQLSSVSQSNISFLNGGLMVLDSENPADISKSLEVEFSYSGTSGPITVSTVVNGVTSTRTINGISGGYRNVITFDSINLADANNQPIILTFALPSNKSGSLSLKTSNNVYFYAPGEGQNDYYCYTNGTITYSGSGHSVVSADNVQEKKLFLNTIAKAIRGANMAPTVEVFGIQDNQYVIVNPELDFSFIAKDFDGGPKMDANIYVDKNNDGDYVDAGELVKSYLGVNGVVNGATTNVALMNLGIPNGQTFKVKVEAIDIKSAKGIKVITLVNATPTLTATVIPKTGYLAGDTDTLSYVVSRSGINGTVNLVTNISALSGLSPSSIGWVSSGSNLTHDVSGSGGTYTMPVSFNSAGTYTVSNSFTNNDNVVPGMGSTFAINVKSGILDVEVKDAQSRGIKDVQLSIVRAEDGQVIKNTDGTNPKTGNTGYWTRQDMPTGTYNVTITVPNGYSLTGSTTQSAVLNYEYFAANERKKISFLMGSSLVDQATLSDITGTKDSVTTIENGTLKSRFNFKLLSAVKELKFVMDRGILGSKLEIKTASLIKDIGVIGNYTDDEVIGNVTVTNGNLLTLPMSSGTLGAGNYYIVMSVFCSKPIIIDTYDLLVNEARLQDNSKPYNLGDYEPQSIDTAKLEIKIIAKPRIE